MNAERLTSLDVIVSNCSYLVQRACFAGQNNRISILFRLLSLVLSVPRSRLHADDTQEHLMWKSIVEFLGLIFMRSHRFSSNQNALYANTHQQRLLGEEEIHCIRPGERRTKYQFHI